MKNEVQNIVKSVSKKYNKKEEVILLMFEFLKIKRYNIKDSKELIEKFFKSKKSTALILH